jgi:hypothetical protein
LHAIRGIASGYLQLFAGFAYFSMTCITNQVRE